MGTVSPSSADLRRLIAGAARLTVFTGAGISTESGIPDFRSPGGLWTRMKPIPFQDYVASAEVRRDYWRRRFEGPDTLGDARPNRGHYAVAELVRRGVCETIVTQNIDGLHQAAGVPADRVVEIHGTAGHAACLDCALRLEIAAIRRAFEATGEAPDCPSCGGIVKTATISFGQPMPELEMLRAQEASLSCDLFIAIGSSLQVMPAAGLPLLAKRNGAALVILNRDPTELDAYADLVLRAEIGPTLAAAVAAD